MTPFWWTTSRGPKRHAGIVGHVGHTARLSVVIAIMILVVVVVVVTISYYNNGGGWNG